MTYPGEIAARAIARVEAEKEGVPKKDRDRYVEETWSLQWLHVQNAMAAWRREGR